MDVMRDGATLVLAGDFDVRSTWEVRNAIYELLGSHDGDVDAADLGHLDHDVTALKVLAVATRQAARNGHHLKLRGCSPAVRRLLHLSHLRWMLPVEPFEAVPSRLPRNLPPGSPRSPESRRHGPADRAV